MSSNEKRKDSRQDKDCSDDESQDKFENCDINLARTGNENSTSSVIKLASENDHLHFSRSLEVSNQLSNQPPGLYSQAPNIDKLDENTDVISSKQRGCFPCVSQNNYESPLQQHARTSSVSVLGDSDASEPKTSQKDTSPLSCGRKADFTSPPEQGSVSMIKSLSQNLKEINTPSPDKRRFRSEAVSPPIKKMRKTPENDSSKPGSKTESYRSNLSFSAPAKISGTSPINLRIQQTEGAVQMNEDGYSHTPSIAKARKKNVTRNKSVRSEKVANDNFLPIMIPSDTSLKKEKNENRLVESSSRIPTRSESTKVLDFSRRMRRRSSSDGALTSRNSTKIKMEQQQSNSSVRSNLKETRFSSNLREALKGFTPETCNVNPPPPESPSIPARNINSLNIKSHSTLSNRVMSEVTENRPSSEAPTSRNQPEVPLQLNRNVPLHQRRHEGLFTAETFPSRKPPEMVSGVNIPYIDIVEGQPSSSRYQPLVRDLSFAFDEAATSRNQLDSSNRTSTLYTHSRSESAEMFDFSRRGLHRRSASDGALTSRYLNEIKTEQEQTHSSIDSSRNVPEMARRINRRIPAAEEQASASRGNIVNSRSYVNPPDLSSGQPPISHSLHNANAGERTRNMFRKSKYVVEARHLLQWVLKEITQLNGEVDFWRKFERLFNRISSNCAEVEYFFLSYKLEQYRADRGYGLWSRTLGGIIEMNAATSTTIAYERLILVVVRTLALTLGVETDNSDFSLFLIEYSKLVNLYNEFLRNSNIYSVEDLPDEVSRNRIKTLKKKFENLRLLTLSAIRLLLMYIGENSDEESMERFEFFHVIDEEDKTFLRRKGGF